MTVFLLFVIACGIIYFVLKDITRRRAEKDYLFIQNEKKQKLEDAQKAFLEIMGPDDQGTIDFNARIKDGRSSKEAIDDVFLSRMYGIIGKIKNFSDATPIIDLFKRAGFKYEMAADVASTLEKIIDQGVEEKFIINGEMVQLANYKKACKDHKMSEELQDLLLHKFDDFERPSK